MPMPIPTPLATLTGLRMSCCHLGTGGVGAPVADSASPWPPRSSPISFMASTGTKKMPLTKVSSLWRRLWVPLFRFDIPSWSSPRPRDLQYLFFVWSLAPSTLSMGSTWRSLIHTLTLLHVTIAHLHFSMGSIYLEITYSHIETWHLESMDIAS